MDRSSTKLRDRQKTGVKVAVRIKNGPLFDLYPPKRIPYPSVAVRIKNGPLFDNKVYPVILRSLGRSPH